MYVTLVALMLKIRLYFDNKYVPDQNQVREYLRLTRLRFVSVPKEGNVSGVTKTK